MALTKQQILEAIPSFKSHDIADIIEWCHSFGPRSTRYGDNPNTEQAYQELCRCFADYFKRPYSDSLLRFAHAKPRQYKALITATDHAVKCVADWWPDEHRVVRIALLKYICRVAFNVCTRRSAQFDWGRVIKALGETEATINDAFPGWLRAGMFQERALAKIKPVGGKPCSAKIPSASKTSAAAIRLR